MGEYEDLIQRAREGDTSALDELEQNYSGSTLRTKAEEADRWKQRYQEAMPHLRQARVDELKGKLSEDLRAHVSADDFADTEPDSITLEALQDRASSRRESEQNRKLAAAQDAGFETVEEYEEALQAVKTQKSQRKSGMEEVGSGASGGGDPEGLDEPTRWDKSKEAYEKAKSEGATSDRALAAAIGAAIDDQLPEEEV